MKISHQPALVVQENHYYPFGLNITSLDKSGQPEMMFQFMGVEIEENFGLNWQETEFRSYNSQLGRFHQIDKLTDEMVTINPYQYAFNNPIKLNDPSGLFPEKSLADKAHDAVLQEQSDFMARMKGDTKKGLLNGDVTNDINVESRNKNDEESSKNPSRTKPGVNGVPVDLDHDGHEAMISSGFLRNDGITYHGGIDIHYNDCSCYEGVKASTGGSIYSTLTGIVVTLDDGNNGINILNRDKGIMITFMHMSELNVKTGDVVEAGDIIGKMGNVGKSRGAHLHYQIQIAKEGEFARNMHPKYGRDWKTINPIKGISVKKTIPLKRILTRFKVPMQGLKTRGEMSIVAPKNDD